MGETNAVVGPGIRLCHSQGVAQDAADGAVGGRRGRGTRLTALQWGETGSDPQKIDNWCRGQG
ncbi:MAG: hypothetical protein CM15mP77_1760 [Synechococcus sp.]|nr:MAG: hypothetical protein CM15mP77_1760 [Synechococcus sp.]